MEKEKRFADFVFFFLMFLFFLRMRVSFFLIYVTVCAETYENVRKYTNIIRNCQHEKQ